MESFNTIFDRASPRLILYSHWRHPILESPCIRYGRIERVRSRHFLTVFWTLNAAASFGDLFMQYEYQIRCKNGQASRRVFNRFEGIEYAMKISYSFFRLVWHFLSYRQLERLLIWLII